MSSSFNGLSWRVTSSSNGLSWHVTGLSVLAGIGAGYLVGVLTATWLRRGRRPLPPPPPGRDPHPPQSQADLIAALSDLTAEVGSLRTTISELLQQLVNRVSQPYQQPEITISSPPSEGTEFFDIEDQEEIEESSPDNTEYLDELGKTTLENEEVCHTLIAELDRRLEESPDAPPLLWRLARAQVHLSMHCEQKGSLEEEKQLLAQATEHAQRALEVDDSMWQCHQWYAIALGSQIKHEGIQRKVTAGHEYKEHIDTAISLNPDDPNLLYLRGRWAYEVACLSWLEKKAVSALYATPPNATYEEALSDFMKVEQLNRTWKANLLMTAKCYIELGDIPTGVEWLQKAVQLKVVTTEDITAHKEVEELLDTHSYSQVDSYS